MKLFGQEKDALVTGHGFISNKMQAGFFSFGAGALLFGSVLEVLPEGIEAFRTIEGIGSKYASLAGLGSFFLGVILLLGFEIVLKRLAPEVHCPCNGLTVSDEEDIFGAKSIYRDNDGEVKSLSLLVFSVMTFHHIPEGLAFYVAVTTDLKVGTIIGLILLLHVIPEGNSRIFNFRNSYLGANLCCISPSTLAPNIIWRHCRFRFAVWWVNWICMFPIF